MLRLAAIVMAAGFSRRMGENKLLMTISGQPMITSVLTLIQSQNFFQKILVTGHPQVKILGMAYDFLVVDNPCPQKGQSQSVILGTDACRPDIDGFMFFTGDMPKLQADTLKILMRVFETHKNDIIIPEYDGRRGNPVIFPASMRGALLQVTGDRGGRQVIEQYPYLCKYVKIEDGAQGMDIDTPGDYHKL